MPQEDVLDGAIEATEDHIDPAVRAWALYRQGMALQSMAGRQAQKERAEAHQPPRSMMRAFAVASTKAPATRRARKSKARLGRAMQQKYPEAWKRATEG